MEGVAKENGSWGVLMGRSAWVSVGQWQRALTKGAWFSYVGVGRPAAYATAAAVVGLNLTKTHLVSLHFGGYSAKSLRSEGKEMAARTSEELALFETYRFALMLSLRGVNVVVTNQWATPSPINRAYFNLLNESFKRGLSIADALGEVRRGVTYAQPQSRPSSSKKTPRGGPSPIAMGEPVTVLEGGVTFNPVAYGFGDLRLA